jgi:hypothetical protein
MESEVTSFNKIDSPIFYPPYITLGVVILKQIDRIVLIIM